MSSLFKKLAVKAEEETKLIRPSDLPLYGEPKEIRSGVFFTLREFGRICLPLRQIICITVKPIFFYKLCFVIR